MNSGPSQPTWDVLIVAAAKGRLDHGHRLREELERLGLQVKLDLVPVPSVSDLPQDVVADARRAAVLVALIAVRERVGGELRESVGYLLASASNPHRRARGARAGRRRCRDRDDRRGPGGAGGAGRGAGAAAVAGRGETARAFSAETTRRDYDHLQGAGKVP